MERIAKQAMLYDFYGELLTEHQKKIYEDVVYNDFSLSEIAEENGIDVIDKEAALRIAELRKKSK